MIPYCIPAAFIGWGAGYAVSRGAFRRLGTVVLSGLLVGAGAALISAPITAYLFGDATGAGVDYLLSYLTATGADLLQAATLQGFISDPLDKAISFVARLAPVAGSARILPTHASARHPSFRFAARVQCGRGGQPGRQPAEFHLSAGV